MDICWPENLAATQKMLIDEAMEGRELAKQLQNVLAKSDGSGSAKDLVMKILKSFSNVLLLLNVKEGVDQVPVISPIQAQSHVDSPCLDARKAEDSQESSRSSTNRTTSTATPTKNDPRGCYDRRTSRIWKRETHTLTNDGQAWTKNGQKVILDSKYLRHYFRCSFKYDQGCKATKHVQRIQVNPPLYRTTYFGQHTCNKDIYKDPKLFLDCTSPSNTSKFISFDNTNHPNKQEHPFFSSTKQQSEDKKTCDNVIHNHSSSPMLLSEDYNPDDDVVVVESPCRLTMVLSSTLQESSGYYDQMMEYVDCFDPDLFQFD